jgi:hypothetical protein
VLAALYDLQAQYFPGERADDTLESAFDGGFLDPKWRDLVAVTNESGVYQLRALEVATFFELVDALKAGDIHVQGAANYGALTDDIFPMPFSIIHRRSRLRASTPIRTDSRLPCLGLHTCSALS